MVVRCSGPENIKSRKMARPIASAGAEINALKRTKVLRFNRAANEGVKLNDLNANDTWRGDLNSS